MRRDSEASTLSQRIVDFKSDPERYNFAVTFVDDVIEEARKRAEFKMKEKQRFSFDRFGEQAGSLKRRLGTRTRGFFTRVFDAFCNCSQTAANAARTAAAAARTASFNRH